jgi:hypothetical protein
VLAALARAALHRGERHGAVPAWAILAHLGIPRRAALARHVRALLVELEAAGQVRADRRHGASVWTLTRAGRARLQQAAARGEDVRLPESPQHLAWRQARASAALELARFRRSLGASLADARAQLRAGAPAPSQEWFELAERLRREAWLVGSASHCLYEWREPDDARADIDDGPPGRRNVRLWRESTG